MGEFDLSRRSVSLELFLIAAQQYTPEFRRSVVNLVFVEGLSVLPNDDQFFDITRI